jgi:hypothetical protein
MAANGFPKRFQFKDIIKPVLRLVKWRLKRPGLPLEYTICAIHRQSLIDSFRVIHDVTVTQSALDSI